MASALLFTGCADDFDTGRSDEQLSSRTERRGLDLCQPEYSGGSGGALEDAFFLPFETTVQGASVFSEYNIYAGGLDWEKPVGLFIWLHGDGADEYYSALSNSPCMVMEPSVPTIARAHNMLLVVPRTPLQNITWWNGDKNINARWVADLGHSLMESYNLDRQRVWFGTYSGGSEFVSYNLFSHNGPFIEEFGSAGGAIIFAGGGTPWGREGLIGLDPFPMRYFVGEYDYGSDPGWDGRVATEESYEWFGQQGYDTQLTIVPGRDHYMEDVFSGIVDEVFSQELVDIETCPCETGYERVGSECVLVEVEEPDAGTHPPGSAQDAGQRDVRDPQDSSNLEDDGSNGDDTTQEDAAKTDTGGQKDQKDAGDSDGGKTNDSPDGQSGDVSPGGAADTRSTTTSSCASAAGHGPLEHPLLLVVLTMGGGFAVRRFL